MVIATISVGCKCFTGKISRQGAAGHGQHRKLPELLQKN
jgi:hypothetical protein